jgi:hypothetical protein
MFNFVPSVVAISLHEYSLFSLSSALISGKTTKIVDVKNQPSPRNRILIALEYYVLIIPYQNRLRLMRADSKSDTLGAKDRNDDTQFM